MGRMGGSIELFPSGVQILNSFSAFWGHEDALNAGPRLVFQSPTWHPNCFKASAMSASNIVSLSKFKILKAAEDQEMAYKARILGMDKLQLLEEMVRFQEEKTHTGKMSVEMMVRGHYLFKQLEENAETQELRILTRSYRRHLEMELAELKKAQI